jgi:hypothetical protein
VADEKSSGWWLVKKEWLDNCSGWWEEQWLVAGKRRWLGKCSG